MKLSIDNSLFKKVFVLTFFAAILPICLSMVSFWVVDNGGAGINFTPIFYGSFLMAVFLAGAGAYYFSKHLSLPIKHFIKSATEIARGDFSQRVPIESNDEIGRLARIFNYMVTELRRLDQMNLNKIINEKNKTETILRNVADGVIVTDPGDKIVLINLVAQNWFNVRDSEAVDRAISDVVKQTSLLQLINETASADHSKPQNIEVSLEPQGGRKPIVLQGRAARIVNEKAELIGIVTILRDITHEKEIDRLKTELVSLVAHELRSPLTCITGFSELLLDPSLESEQSEEYATIILKESNRLSDLINKFLDISKIEAGKSQVRKSPVDMKMLVEKVLDFNSQLADKKDIAVTFDSPNDVSVVHLDRDMIEQVVLNLFSNAVKYSPEKATVAVRLIENESKMYVEVEDTGFGISEKALPHIFDKFYRITDNEQVRDITGSGLGLALVKEIVEIHGGSVKVRSTLGKGSIFTITLPKEESAMPPDDETLIGLV
jgi:two-component system phosphate regulon sensor histidine kinase PhoR